MRSFWGRVIPNHDGRLSLKYSFERDRISICRPATVDGMESEFADMRVNIKTKTQAFERDHDGNEPSRDDGYR